MTTTTFISNTKATSEPKTWVTETVRTFWYAVKRYNRQRRAVEHFRSMTDQHMQDIGIRRHEVFTMIYGTNTDGVHRFSSTNT